MGDNEVFSERGNPIPAKQTFYQKKVREMIESSKRERLLFWNTLVSNSQEYIYYLGLDGEDIDHLCDLENLKRPPMSERGFLNICVDSENFVFIPVYDIGVNNGFEEDWKFRSIIMAFCLSNSNLNKSNGQEDPWISKEYESCNYDDEGDVLPVWTTIVPDDWHRKIIFELKKEA